jgi:hypothetical protein
MFIFRSRVTRYGFAFFLGAIIGTMYAMSAIAANADEIPSQISVAQNGVTMVKGATITKIQGNEITAVTTWGKTKMQWRVIVTGSTRMTPSTESKKMLASLRVGHTIGFSGSLDMRSGAPTIFAGALKNESMLLKSTVVGGSVLAIDGPRLVVQTQNGTSTVVTSTGTITTMDGDTAKLADLVPGMLVNVTGTLNTLSKELKAERVSALTPGVPHRNEAPQPTVWDNILGWIATRGGALSVR